MIGGGNGVSVGENAEPVVRCGVVRYSEVWYGN